MTKTEARCRYHLELRKGRDGEICPHWYGVYNVDGRRKVVNLRVPVEGKRPRTLRQRGDRVFEQSCREAELKLAGLARPIIQRNDEAGLLTEIYKLRTGGEPVVVPMAHLVKVWREKPRKRGNQRRRKTRSRSDRYSRQTEATIDRFVSWMADRYPEVVEAGQVTKDHAKAFMDEEENRVGAKTFNDILSTLSGIFAHLVDEEDKGVVRNPFAGIDRLDAKIETHNHRALTEEEIRRLLDVLKDDGLLRPLFVTGMSTAIRLADCCRLKWADIRRNQTRPGGVPIPDMVVVKPAKTRNSGDTEICVPINDALEEELRRAAGSRTVSEFVWPECEAFHRTRPTRLSNRIARVFEHAGLSDYQEREEAGSSSRRANRLGFPSLRTTWCSEALAGGVPAADVAAIAGHSGTAMIQKHYDRRTSAVRAMTLIGNGGVIGTSHGNGKVKSLPGPTTAATQEAIAILEASTAATWKADRQRLLELLGPAKAVRDRKKSRACG